MLISICALTLVIILALVVDILNKKCNTITENLSVMKKATTAEFDSVRDDADKRMKSIEVSEDNLSRKIDVLKDDSDAAFREVKRQAENDAKNAFINATKYVDQKFNANLSYANALHDDLLIQFEERIGILTSIIDSLTNENAKLREELNEQKKKLNFYANIEDAAENLTVKEDTEERNGMLEAIRKDILSRKTNSNSIKPENESAPGEGRLLPAPSEIPVLLLRETSINKSDNTNTSLDKEQAFARDYMDNLLENVFITGKAGTGKSFLLDIFRLTTKKSNIVLAPTGIAALNVNGATLHSTFGYYNLVNLNVDDITKDTIRLKSEKRAVLRHVKTIIIDEISMVRADTFDKIDRILKVINQSDLPFGGKQLLIFGDLFQLPPVTRGQEYEYLLDKYGGIFFFHLDAYKAGNFKFIELTENHRQKGDERFFEILNRIREGKVTVEDIEVLNTRYTPDESIYDRFTALFPTKAEAERVNKIKMDQIESSEYIFSAEVIIDRNPNKNKSLETIFPISEELHLRLGANVMMVANDPKGRWVNGTVGIIKELSNDKIVVSFGKNRNYEIPQFEFVEQEIAYTDGKITYEKVFSVMQYPVVPAYAITIHKSQGQTYDNVMCDIDRCFASGQAYVALSRCSSLKGLHLKKCVTLASIRVDHEVLDFYQRQLENDLLH